MAEAELVTAFVAGAQRAGIAELVMRLAPAAPAIGIGIGIGIIILMVSMIRRAMRGFTARCRFCARMGD